MAASRQPDKPSRRRAVDSTRRAGGTEPRRGDRSRDTRRRFEQWARNPSCQANCISAVFGIRMAEVAKSEGIQPSMGQSPFAILRGSTFERAIFRNDAERLYEALRRAGVLDESAAGFLDLRLRMNGGGSPTLDHAMEQTLELLRRIAAASTAAARRAIPSIVAGAAFKIPGGVMLPEAILVPDVVIIRWPDNHAQLTVAEVKTYPDRGGYTDRTELATARAQAGVYVHGLEIVLDENNLRNAIRLNDRGVLVLTRPGSNFASIRANEDLRHQIARARRGFEMLRQVERSVAMAAGADPLAVVRGAPTAYCESCLAFCDRAPGCFKRALEAADPVVLGEDVARFLGPVDLDRACSLLQGASPANEAERDLALRLAEAATLLEGP